MKKLLIGIGVVAVIAGVSLFTLKKDTPEGKSLLKESVALLKKGNSSSGSFEELLAYVPANTSYLFGNKNAIPQEYALKQMEKVEKFVDLFKDMSVEDKNSSSRSVDFISNYYEKFIKLYKDDNLKSMGYKKGQRVVLYGYKLYPVLRAEIIDSKAFINTINSIAKDSNVSVEWESCGKFQCLKAEDPNSELMTAFVVKDKSIALSLYTKDIKDDMFKHLTQATSTKNSYSMDKFNKVLTENSFKGFGDGFVDLELLTSKLITNIEKEVPQTSRVSFNSCSPIATDIAKKVNKIYIGTAELSLDKMRMLMIFNMDGNLTKSLQGITNKNLFTQRVANPLIDLGLNLNAQGLSNAIMELANYIASQGEKYGCKDIDAQALRQGSAMASMSIGMSLGQLSEIYLSVNDIEFNKEGTASKLGANLQISAPNSSSLMGMLSMLSPELSRINIPTTGEEVDILNVVPKPIPPFITELKASIKDTIISLRLGEKSKMEQFKPKEHTILWSKINSKKYYKLISKVLKENKNMEIPAGVPAEERAEYEAMVKTLAKNNEKVEKLMEVLYSSDIISSQSIYVSDRGLVMEFSQENQGK